MKKRFPKKILAFTLALVLLLALGAPALAEYKNPAMVSPQSLTVDGKTIDCEKYNIDGRNYFKLRDLAQLLNGTNSQFDVNYEEGTNTAVITTNHAYTTPNGTELAVAADQSATAVLTPQTVKIDDVVRTDLTAYNIGGNNFFPLVELGKLLNFDVDYDAVGRAMLVTTK